MAFARLGIFTLMKKTKVYRPGMNNGLPKRLNWEQIEKRPRQEEKNVVKGTNKRIVVVKSPDPKIFEQAIFIVREDFSRRKENSGADVLKEAERVADEYIRSSVTAREKLLSKLPPAAVAGLGAAAAGLVFAVLYFIGI